MMDCANIQKLSPFLPFPSRPSVWLSLTV